MQVVDLKLKKLMEDQNLKNEIFMSVVQSVQKVNECQLQLINDLVCNFSYFVFIFIFIVVIIYLF